MIRIRVAGHEPRDRIEIEGGLIGKIVLTGGMAKLAPPAFLAYIEIILRNQEKEFNDANIDAEATRLREEFNGISVDGYEVKNNGDKVKLSRTQTCLAILISEVEKRTLDEFLAEALDIALAISTGLKSLDKLVEEIIRGHIPEGLEPA